MKTTLTMMVLLGANAPLAFADEPTNFTPQPHPDYMQNGNENALQKYGFTLSLGGGVEGFTDNTMRDTTTVGGDWNVRAAIGTKFPISGEASYLGSAQAIDALGLDSSAVLVGNGVQGDIRINATTKSEVQPFIYGGVAWRRYSLTNESFNTSDVNDSDDVMEIPLGIGLAYNVGNFVVDARGELRPTFFESLVPEATGSSNDAPMHRWGINANLGYRF